MLLVNAKRPTSCNYCNASGTGVCHKWCHNKKMGTVPPDCPVKGELPESHGPLKDADVMLEMLKRACAPDDLTYTIALGYLEAIIKDAPTVVEASCREEDK